MRPPVVRRIKVQGAEWVYVHYGPTLTQVFEARYFDHLMRYAGNPGDEVAFVPVWEVYTCGGSRYYTIVGPVKLVFTREEVKDLRPGLYRTDEYIGIGTFADVPVVVTRGIEDRCSRLPDDIGYEVTLKIKERTEVVSFEYESYKLGVKCKIVRLEGAYIAEIVSGPYVTVPLAIAVPCRELKPGDIVKGRLLLAKAGRADFLQSNYSHQVNVVIVP